MKKAIVGQSDSAKARQSLRSRTTADKLLKIGSLNVAKGFKTKVAELEAYFEKHQFDVVALQEVTDHVAALEHYKAFYPKIRDAKGGVAVLVRNSLAPATAVALDATTDQLWVRIAGSGTRLDLVVCSAYMPQEREPKETRESKFASLTEAADKFSDTTCDFLICGDFNARLGAPTTTQEEELIGKFGEQTERTRNGALLNDVLKATLLVNVGAQVMPDREHDRIPGDLDFWFTRKQGDDAASTLDYMLASLKLWQTVESFRVDYENLASDHFLLSALIRNPRELVRKRSQKKVQRRFKLEKLIPKSSKAEHTDAADVAKKLYQDELASTFADFNTADFNDASCPAKCGTPNCCCAVAADFVRRTNAACEKSVGSASSGGKFSREWFDDEVRAAIKTRRAAHAKWLKDDDELTWKTYTRARRACKRFVMRKKKELWAKFMAKIEDAYENDHKELWRLVKRLAPTGTKVSVAPVRDAAGKLAKSEEAILDVWGVYQAKLGTPSVHELEDTGFADRVRTQVQQFEQLSPIIRPSSMDAEIDGDEIRAVVDELGYDKAKAADGTLNPMYKCGGDKMIELLTILFNHLRNSETIAANWQEALMVNLFKDGDPTDPSNYRGIALISCLGKIYLSIWAKRLGQHGETVLRDAQGGFRARRSTIDQALAFHEILKSRQEEKKKTYVCFIDFRKAFDTVWHDGLWKRLWDSGIRGKAWRIIKNLYKNIQAQVLVGDAKTKSVRMRQGVRQGCPLSPILFNFFVDELAKMLENAGVGVQFCNEIISSLLYADDVVLMAGTKEELQVLINTVDKFCRRWHMDINLKKSEVMVVLPKKVERGCYNCCLKKKRWGPCGPNCSMAQHWTCRGTTLKVVDKYKYLGIWFTYNLDWAEHINVTLAKADGKTANLRKLFSNKKVPARAKTLVWLSYVRPTLEYGSEVWSADPSQTRKLEQRQTTAGTKIFALNKKAHRCAVRALMQVPPLKERRLRGRFRYYAKVKHMQRERLARRIIEFGKQRWIKHTESAIKKAGKDDSSLLRGFEHLQKCLGRHRNELPAGIDPLLLGYGDEPWYNPMAHWRRKTEQWTAQTNLDMTKGMGQNGRSTLRLLLRASNDGDMKMPRYPVTRRPNSGPDLLRVRLLCGTNSLNHMMHKIARRELSCPMEDCVEEETTQHFLLDCPAYTRARETFMLALTTCCTCSSEDENPNCADFFGDLDSVGKILFMLGGPVDGRTPEAAIDAASRAYVDFAWAQRCRKLQDDAAEPLVIDLTATRINTQQHALTHYFTSHQAGNPTGSTDVRSPRARSSARTHARSLRNNNGSAVDDSESGFNGPTAKKSD
jgi:exonuclease III